MLQGINGRVAKMKAHAQAQGDNSSGYEPRQKKLKTLPKRIPNLSEEDRQVFINRLNFLFSIRAPLSLVARDIVLAVHYARGLALRRRLHPEETFLTLDALYMNRFVPEMPEAKDLTKCKRLLGATVRDRDRDTKEVRDKERGAVMFDPRQDLFEERDNPESKTPKPLDVEHKEDGENQGTGQKSLFKRMMLKWYKCLKLNHIAVVSDDKASGSKKREGASGPSHKRKKLVENDEDIAMIETAGNEDCILKELGAKIEASGGEGEGSEDEENDLISGTSQDLCESGKCQVAAVANGDHPHGKTGKTMKGNKDCARSIWSQSIPKEWVHDIIKALNRSQWCLIPIVVPASDRKSSKLNERFIKLLILASQWVGYNFFRENVEGDLPIYECGRNAEEDDTEEDYCAYNDGKPRKRRRNEMQSSESSKSITDLNDEDLVNILQYFSAEELLFNLALTCDRFSRLIHLDHRVWKHVSLSGASKELKEVMNRCLPQVPALDSLTLKDPTMDECVHIATCTKFVRRLVVCYRASLTGIEGPLLRYAEHLEELTLKGKFTLPILAVIDTLSLKSLTLYGRKRGNPHFDFTLRDPEEATLEHLEIGGRCMKYAASLIYANQLSLKRVVLWSYSKDVCDALPACENLEEAELWICNRIDKLEGCPGLHTLTLHSKAHIKDRENIDNFLMYSNVMAELRDLTISWTDEVSKLTIVAIAKGCKNLRVLGLSTSSLDMNSHKDLIQLLSEMKTVEVLQLHMFRPHPYWCHALERGALPSLEKLALAECTLMPGWKRAVEHMKYKRPGLVVTEMHAISTTEEICTFDAGDKYGRGPALRQRTYFV